MLRKAATDTVKWRTAGMGSKAFMKHPDIEMYGEYAINLGIMDEMNTELNMSPEGKIRRKALYQKKEADKQFQKFSEQYMDKKGDGELNLTLKQVK